MPEGTVCSMKTKFRCKERFAILTCFPSLFLFLWDSQECRQLSLGVGELAALTITALSVLLQVFAKFGFVFCGSLHRPLWTACAFSWLNERNFCLKLSRLEFLWFDLHPGLRESSCQLHWREICLNWECWSRSRLKIKWGTVCQEHNFVFYYRIYFSLFRNQLINGLFSRFPNWTSIHRLFLFD